MLHGVVDKNEASLHPMLVQREGKLKNCIARGDLRCNECIQARIVDRRSQSRVADQGSGVGLMAAIHSARSSLASRQASSLRLATTR